MLLSIPYAKILLNTVSGSDKMKIKIYATAQNKYRLTPLFEDKKGEFFKKKGNTSLGVCRALF